jgi:hypothetical protein
MIHGGSLPADRPHNPHADSCNMIPNDSGVLHFCLNGKIQPHQKGSYLRSTFLWQVATGRPAVSAKPRQRHDWHQINAIETQVDTGGSHRLASLGGTYIRASPGTDA